MPPPWSAPAAPFIRRLYDLQATVSKSHHHIHLSAGIPSDLAWWRTYLETRMIIGSALYTHALKPASSSALHYNMTNINVVQGIKHILKSHSSLKKLTSQYPFEWPVTKVVLSRIRKKNGGKVYQVQCTSFQGCHHKSCVDQALVDLKSLNDLALSGQI